MGLSNKLFYEAGSFSCHLNPQRFFQSDVLRLYFPTLVPWVAWSVSVPSCSSWFICTQMWESPLCQPPPCCESPLTWLPISAPPTSLDECFFFNSLVVTLPYSLVFWQFWLFFAITQAEYSSCALPASLDECFFFNSLVVGLPYSSIFWQFWIIFYV